jgi:hypothetical protein
VRRTTVDPCSPVEEMKVSVSARGSSGETRWTSSVCEVPASRWTVVLETNAKLSFATRPSMWACRAALASEMPLVE